MLKNTFFSIILATFIAVSANSPAQGADTAPATAPKIVVVDIQRIMRDSLAAKDLKTQLESKKNQYQADLKGKSDKLKKEKDDLEKQQSVLSKDALTQKVKNLNSEFKSAQDDANEKSVRFENAEKGASRDILAAVQEIINDLAKEQNFNIAIPTSQLLFAHKDLDITNEVLTRLDKKLPKLTLKFEK